MKKVFLDTNILVYYVDNDDFRLYAELIVELSKTGDISLFASYLTFANMAYILRKKTVEQQYALLKAAKSVVTVLPCDVEQLNNALCIYAKDFEDLLQFQCAKAFDCDVIITNNKKDFLQFNDIPVLTPEEFLLEY